MDKKYEVVEITFINENDERITINLESGIMVTPETLSSDSRGNALLRTGAFIAAGKSGLKKLWEGFNS